MLKTTLLGLFYGTIGTTIGGLIGIFTKKSTNKFLSFVLSFASGLMLAVVCFSLIPEALNILDISMVTIGIIIGIGCMIVCESWINKNYINKDTDNNDSWKILKTGIIVSVGIAIHNIPEGIAIGSGYAESSVLGLSLAIAICMHDIPEGLSMAVPMKKGGMKPWKIMLYVISSGLATGIGALFGAWIGNISDQVISMCLSFAAGAMIYIVSGELIPEYNKLYQGRLSGIGNMAGFIIGLLAMIIL